MLTPWDNSTTSVQDLFNGAFYMCQYQLTLTKTVDTWIRIDIVADFAAFGGIMSLVTLLLSAFLGPLINFENDLDMTRALYTVNRQGSKNRSNIQYN